jgi:hypothetical protein
MTRRHRRYCRLNAGLIESSKLPATVLRYITSHRLHPNISPPRSSGPSMHTYTIISRLSLPFASLTIHPPPSHRLGLRAETSTASFLIPQFVAITLHTTRRYLRLTSQTMSIVVASMAPRLLAPLQAPWCKRFDTTSSNIRSPSTFTSALFVRSRVICQFRRCR